MDENKKNDISNEISHWMKATLKYWDSVSEFQNFDMFKDVFKTEKKSYSQAKKMFQTGGSIYKLFFTLLSEPENVNAMLKGTEILPDVYFEIFNSILDGNIEFQKTWTDFIFSLGKHSKAYSFDDIDQDLFKSWRNLYENEFKKFFNIPQLGLTRYYQERVNNCIDKYNIFSETLIELLYLFYIPFEKTNIVMQEKIEQLLKNGDIYDNSNDYYKLWLRILEGHYMNLLKSPEYIKVMNSTVQAYVQYKNAKDAVLYDLLQHLPIPTNKDMDDLYKELYLLKKKVRELTNEIQSLKNEKQQTVI